MMRNQKFCKERVEHTNSFLLLTEEQLTRRRAHPVLVGLVFAVRWVDARHLEHNREESQPLLSPANALP